jgi:hypothetical protein
MAAKTATAKKSGVKLDLATAAGLVVDRAASSAAWWKVEV